MKTNADSGPELTQENNGLKNNGSAESASLK